MRPQEDILARVDSALKTHPHLRRVLVKSQQQQDRVVLSGNVSTFFQKQMAQEALRNIPGVQEIDNQLSVDYS
ncbi:BON domain-containing protein [Roseimaritima ulvae]|uniref:BON domain protein n=1 Tax=Roseimaritima ulvae TaxID=980254 RepID=A0A5B9QWG2_9BACT|nr:BON domain-containing protein [Roseimaritima ulvae]QEG42239.1 BON domain protein [Roseimaritima ulvae]